MSKHSQSDIANDVRSLRARIDELICTLRDFEVAWKRSIGITHTIEHEGIIFNVSRMSLVADLSPLAFLHLSETVDGEGEQAAAARLHGRILPLLDCRHRWSSPGILEDSQWQSIFKGNTPNKSLVYRCDFCSAHALEAEGRTLPSVGRFPADREI